MKLLHYLKIAMVCLAAAVLVAGCATTRTEPASASAAVAESAITAAEMAAVFGEKETGNSKLETGEKPAKSAKDVLTPEEVLRIAAEKNPSFAEYAAAREAALAEVMAAAAWQNPSLEAGAGRGKTRGTPSTSGVEYSLGLIQPVEWPGKRAVRKEAAAAGVAVAELDGALFRSTLRADVLRAYETVSRLGLICWLSDEELSHAQKEEELMVRRIEAGEGAQDELILLKCQRLSIAEENMGVKREYTLSLSVLNTLCGRALPVKCIMPPFFSETHAWRAEFPKGEIPLMLFGRKDSSKFMVKHDAAIDLALRKHPTILKLAAEKQRCELLVKQAELAKKPDFTPGLEVSRGVDVLSWGARLGMELPFWNRNKAGIAAAKAELHRVEAQLAARRQNVEGEVEKAIIDYERKQKQYLLSIDKSVTSYSRQTLYLERAKAGEADESEHAKLGREAYELCIADSRVYLELCLARIQLEQAIGYGELK